MVTRLKPRRGSYENALEAYASGDFSLSSELLSSAVTLAESILLGRSLLRLGMPAQALDAISPVELADAPHELVAEAMIVQATCLNLLHRFDEASKLLVEARVRSISAGITAIEAELLLVEVVGHLLEGNYTLAEDSAHAILRLESDSPTWFRPTTYRLNLAYLRFRACDLLGAVEKSQSNYALQSHWLRQAFEEFDKSGVRDDYMEAVVLSNFADVSLGLGLDDVVDVVLARSKRIEWSAPLAGFEFRTFSALAEASSGAGDQLGALRYLRRCNSCAPTATFQLRSTVERARILSEIGEAFSSREELDHAIKLSKSIDWANVNELEQRQLVFLAAQVASFSASEASRLLARYDGLKCSLPGSVAMRENRFRGEELLARSAVLRATGENGRAILSLIDALELFNSVADPAKAANAAAELAELTHEPHYLEIVRAQCRKQPHSILARKLTRLEAWMSQPVFA